MALKSLKLCAPYLLISAIAAFMFRGIFAPGLMSGYDNPFHYYDAYYLTTKLIPHYHWIGGWSMQGMAGLPIFIDYYQAGFLMIALLNKVLFIPLNLSYKLMVLFSYIFLTWGFYRLSSYRFGLWPSLIMSVCLMLQKDIYLDRILGGIWNNYLAIGLFFLFLHFLDKYNGSLNLKRAAALGLMLGLLILTHIFVAICAFVLLLIYAIPSFLKRPVQYLLIPALAFLVSSYYLYGFVVAKNYFAPYPSKDILTGLLWSFKSLFGPVEGGVNTVSGFFINLPVMARSIFSLFGIYIFLAKEKNRALRRFLFSVLLFMLFSIAIFSDIFINISDAWRRIPFIEALQSNRFLIYVQISAYIFAAYGIFKILGRLRRKNIFVVLFLTLLTASIAFHYTYLARDGSKTLSRSVQMADVFKVWNWVDRNIKPGDFRIVYESTIANSSDPILARSDVFALSGVFTKIPQIGAARSATPFPQEKYTRNDQGMIFGRPIKDAADTYIRDMMNYFNARYIVSVEPMLKDKLKNSPLFVKDAEYGEFSIFNLSDFDGGWVKFSKDAGYKTVKLEDESAIFDISNKSAGNEAYIKIAYHPLWHAALNGAPVTLGHDDRGLMKIYLPQKGDYRLSLLFKSVNHFWLSVSFVSLLTGLFIILRGRS